MSLYRVPVILVIATLVLSFAACSSGPNGQELSYGTGTLYYLPPVTEVEAKRFVAWANKTWGPPQFGQPKSMVQLKQESGAYELGVVVKEGIDIDSIAPDLAFLACEMESEVFDGAVDTVNVLAFKHDDTSFDGEILRREFCRTASDVQKKVAPPAPATPTRESPSDMHLAISKKYFDSGTGYLLNGEYEIAIQEFDKAIEIYPDNAYAYHNRGISLGKLGQYSLAEKDSNKACELDRSLC